MITLEKRLHNYLDSYEFYPNSVDFRIVSSKAIERFKNVQAFNLNEIRNGKYEFSRTRREVLLLKFDLLSRTLYEIENLCIQFYHDGEIATQNFVTYAIKLISKSKDIYNEIVTEKHPEEFDEFFTEVWLKILNNDVNILLDGIRDLVGLGLVEFFNSLVTVMSRLIQNSTLGLYELDTLTSKKDFVDSDDSMLVITNYINSGSYGSKRHLKNKIKIYKEYFKIKYIYLKNLSDEPINPDIIKFIEDSGLIINYKRSLNE